MQVPKSQLIRKSEIYAVVATYSATAAPFRDTVLASTTNAIAFASERYSWN